MTVTRSMAVLGRTVISLIGWVDRHLSVCLVCSRSLFCVPFASYIIISRPNQSLVVKNLNTRFHHHKNYYSEYHSHSMFTSFISTINSPVIQYGFKYQSWRKRRHLHRKRCKTANIESFRRHCAGRIFWLLPSEWCLGHGGRSTDWTAATCTGCDAGNGNMFV
jgi:hypothetical protein